jgi:hypothetical protein
MEFSKAKLKSNDNKASPSEHSEWKINVVNNNNNNNNNNNITCTFHQMLLA